MPDFITPDMQYTLFYETRDLYEAAVIHAFQHPVLEVKRQSDGVCYFVFDDRAHCEKLVSDFRNRVLMINAKAFVESMRTMKDFIHSEERRRE